MREYFMFKATMMAGVFVLGVTGLIGCQSHNQMLKESELSSASIDILAQESQKALLAQKSLKTAQAEELRQIQRKQARFNVDLISANYIGTPEVLLNSIATSYGYRYLESGSSKTLPIVNFTDRKVTAFELVKDVGVFVDGYANITVDHQNKTIILTYK